MTKSEDLKKQQVLWGMSQYAVAGTNKKCPKEGQLVNQQQGHRHPRLNDAMACGMQWLACLVQSHRTAEKIILNVCKES